MTHEAILGGTVNALQKAYPEADMRTARTTQETLEFLATGIPTLIVMDLSIPRKGWWTIVN